MVNRKIAIIIGLFCICLYSNAQLNTKCYLFFEGFTNKPFGKSLISKSQGDITFDDPALFSNFQKSGGFAFGSLFKCNSRIYLGAEFSMKYFGDWQNETSDKYLKSNAIENGISVIFQFNNIFDKELFKNAFFQVKPGFSFYNQENVNQYYLTNFYSRNSIVSKAEFKNQYKSFSGTNAALSFTIGNAFNILENWKIYVAYEFSYIYYSSNSIENSRFANNGIKIGFFRELFPKKTYYY